MDNYISCSALAGRNCRRLRKAHGYTIEKLAELLDRNPKTIRRWETEGI